MNVIRRFIQCNVKASNGLDALFPARFSLDGNSDFRTSFALKYLRPKATVYDIGGGKCPFVDAHIKRQLGLRVVGLDISREELQKAPDGIYDQLIDQDIANYIGAGGADVVICQALLEHVEDIEGAFQGITSCMNKGATACIFVPSRNAVFARLNLALPHKLKRRLLYSIFPGTRETQGFQSYYSRCTPRDFEQLARSSGCEVVEVRYYYVSKYFSFFTPLYALWRLWFFVFYALKGSQASETFSIALRKL